MIVLRVERISACRADTAVTRSSAAAVLQFYFGPALGFMKRREMASVHLVFIYAAVYRCRAQFYSCDAPASYYLFLLLMYRCVGNIQFIRPTTLLYNLY